MLHGFKKNILAAYAFCQPVKNSLNQLHFAMWKPQVYLFEAAQNLKILRINNLETKLKHHQNIRSLCYIK